jgi:superfamily II DNA helicase RecQ
LSHIPNAINIPQGVSETDKPQYVLKTLFGYDAFRLGHLEAIKTILSGGDCLILLPT